MDAGRKINRLFFLLTRPNPFQLTISLISNAFFLIDFLSSDTTIVRYVFYTYYSICILSTGFSPKVKTVP